MTFSNRPAATAILLPFAHARVGGVELPIALSAVSGAPTGVYVSPAACLGGWPGGQIDISFDAGLPDAFGVPTTAPLVGGSFLVTVGVSDGGCADSRADVPTD